MPENFKIVVIDDDRGACLYLKKVIEKAGEFSVVTTTDPKAALELCIREKPDLVLLDNVMPEIQGAELAKLLRKNPHTKKIPLVMVTGKGEMVYVLEKETFEWQPNTQTVKERGVLREQENPESLQVAYGVDHYFTKPVNTLKLVELLTKLLAAKREKEELDEWKKLQ